MRIRRSTQKHLDQVLALLKQHRKFWLPMPRVYRTAARILVRRGLAHCQDFTKRPGHPTIVKAYKFALKDGEAAA